MDFHKAWTWGFFSTLSPFAGILSFTPMALIITYVLMALSILSLTLIFF